MRNVAILVLVLFLCGVSQGRAQEHTTVITQHEIRVADRALAYSAQAGRIPIRAMEADGPRAYMFYVSYRSPSDDGAPRPITFVWGGGPSSSGLGTHMNWGPTRVGDGDTAVNEWTLLTESDLVFVDPVGTGFSRPTRKAFAQEFYGVRGDAASVAEFIRAWLALHDPEGAPIFLAGVSYGVWRAAAVAELLEQRGTTVTGVVLASGGMGVGVDVAPPEIVEAHRIPARAAAALHHGRLTAEIATTRSEALREAERWALDVYTPALRRISELSDTERNAVAEQLSRYTGYPLDLIDRETLRVTPREYLNGLLRDEGKTLQQYDMRRTVEESDVQAPSPTERGAELERSIRYLRQGLGYRTDLAYLGVEYGYDPISTPEYLPPGRRWEYDTGTITPEVMAAAQAGQGPPGAEPWMVRALELNPSLKILVGAGLFDSLNSCSGNEDVKARLDPRVAASFTLRCYMGGHGFHREGDTRSQFAGHVRNFLRETVLDREPALRELGR